MSDNKICALCEGESTMPATETVTCDGGCTHDLCVPCKKEIDDVSALIRAVQRRSWLAAQARARLN